MSITPQLHVVFTCTACNTRSQRRLSRQAYTEGVVLVRCSGCQQLHLFADHLGWFSDKRETIEHIMREKGLEVTRVTATDGNTAEAADAPVLSVSAGAGAEGVRVSEHDGLVEIVKER